jgi:hypothetical protein
VPSSACVSTSASISSSVAMRRARSGVAAPGARSSSRSSSLVVGARRGSLELVVVVVVAAPPHHRGERAQLRRGAVQRALRPLMSDPDPLELLTRR